jgi:geranylgeranyl diphosphate synthase type II
LKTNKMDFNFREYLKERQALVNNSLVEFLRQYDENRELVAAMEHSLMAGGKRLRPILAMAAAEACGKDFMCALPASCAIEMIHTYSLIHDDLPAMDDDDLRRGKLTCHKKFNEATAILAGDALLTNAFDLVARPEQIFKIYPDASIRLKLVSIISQAAGVQGMVEGQMLDMQSFSANESEPLAHLKKIHALKTGKMITMSVKAGAMSAEADPEMVDRLVGYADKLGLAFQVVDDILNIEGDPEIMGKAAGSDVLNDKMTFPAIIGLDESKKYAERLMDEAVDSISDFDDGATALRVLAKYIINRNR